MLSSLTAFLIANTLLPQVTAIALPEHVILDKPKRQTSLSRTELSTLGFPVPNPTESYWQIPAHPIANLRTTPELPSDQVFDYVIIGSGISGASTAYKLLNRNTSLSILMLEARTAASGASGRNGGHVRPGDWSSIMEWVGKYGEDEALRIQKLEQECVDDMAEFVSKHNVSSGFHLVESADLFWTQEAFDDAVTVWEFQRELDGRRPGDVGRNERKVYRGEEAREYWGWPEILGAITFRSAIQNPYLTVCAMIEEALSMGLNLQTNTMALGLEQLDSKEWVVETDRGMVKGKKVVLATNGFTNALHPGIRKTEFLAPGRSQVTAVHPGSYAANNSVWSRSASYGDRDTGGNYIVVRAPGDPGEGDVIYGGGQMFSPTRERNITDDSVVNADIALHLHRVGRQVYGYENWGETTKVLKDWTGITCYTEDGFPAVGAMPGEDGLFASVCMNGHGMAWAFRSAEALVETMENGQAPTWFPQAFDINRAFA